MRGCAFNDSRYVEKPILILVLLIDRTHQSCSWWENLIDEDEDCLFWRKLDTFADDVHKLAYSEVCWYEVFLLVDSRDVRLFDLLTDDLLAVSCCPETIFGSSCLCQNPSKWAVE